MKFENLLLIYHLPWGNKSTEIVKRWFRNNSVANKNLILDKELENKFPTLKDIHNEYPDVKTCTVIINPYLRALIKYEWAKNNNIYKFLDVTSFENFLISFKNIKKQNNNLLFKSQTEIIEYKNYDSVVKTTFVLRKENLLDDFKSVQDFVGSYIPLVIRDTEKDYDYKKNYNLKTIDLVTELYQDDIKNFNYFF